MMHCKANIGLMMAGIAAWGLPALAQSTAPTETLPGASMQVTMTINLTTDFGLLSDTQSATPTVTGNTLMTVFPAAPPFGSALVHEQNFVISPFTLNFEFPLLFFTINLDVTLTDLTIVSTGWFDGTVAANGEATFPQPALIATGQVQLVSDDLAINDMIPLDSAIMDPIVVTLGQQGSALVISNLQLPPVDLVVDPAQLPATVSAASGTVSLDASSIVLRGLLAPSTQGDFNGNGSVDLADYPGPIDCFAKAGGGLAAICALADMDGDGDVDLADWHLWLVALGS